MVINTTGSATWGNSGFWCTQCQAYWNGPQHTCPSNLMPTIRGPYVHVYTPPEWSLPLRPQPSEREQWLARGLEQAINWITLDGHVPPAERTLRRSIRRWLLHRLIADEQRDWLAAVLHGNYPAERYPDHPGVKP